MTEEIPKLSQTMRLDLISDIPAEPVAGKQERVVIATPTRRQRRVVADSSEGSSVGGADSHYQELLQSVYDGALVADLHGRIDDCNVRALDFLQYEKEELCALTIFDVISGADGSLMESLSQNLESERFALIQAYCIRKDGSYFPAEIAVNKLRLDTLHLCFFIRDITLRRQAEEMLRTEHTAIQNSSNGIAVAGLDGKLEYVNPAVGRLWGCSTPEELSGADIRQMVSHPEKVDKVLAGVLSDHHSWTGELKAMRLDATEFDVQMAVACNRNTDGEAVGFVMSFADISDRKRAEGAEREAERNRVMLESLGAACHHLGQPATVLLANLGIMEKRMTSQDQLVNDLVKSSIEAAETLGDILHRLNTVNEYKTTQYLERTEGEDSPDNRILDI